MDSKTVICYCAGGLGNRLMPLASCWALAQTTGRRLRVLWREDDMRCQVGFAQLFSNTVDIISDDEMAVLTHCRIYADMKDVYKNFYLTRKDTLIKLIESWGIHDRSQLATDLAVEQEDQHVIIYHNSFLPQVDESLCHQFLRWLRPQTDLLEKINNLRRQLGINHTVMGVHARGTDFHVSVQQYAEKIRTVLDNQPRQRFLVCSDEPEYEQRLYRLFPEHVLIRAKEDHVRRADQRQTWINNTLTSKAAVQEAIVDIYLLACTNFKIFHAGSSFARLINILLNPEFTTPDQPPRIPQRRMPEHFRSAFTMNGRIPVHDWYIDESRRDGNLHYRRDLIERLIQMAENRQPCNYGDTDQWLYQMLERFPIAGKRVLIMGSQVPFYEAVCIAYGAHPTTVELEKITSDDPRLNTMTLAELSANPLEFDAGISISTFEHTGLGRYGDSLDPDGDLKAMLLMRTRIKHGGILFLSVPMRQDVLVWNAHRIYGRLRFPHLVAGWDLLASLGTHADSVTYRDKEYFQPVHVLRNNREAHIDLLVDLFKRHLNPVFIESGTLLGRGVKAALRAGFETIYSIELNPDLYAFNKAQFADQAHVHILRGASPDILPDILASVNTPATFWLDAHRTGGGLDGGSSPYPIIDELRIIQSHPIKSHTLLMDDRRLFETEFNVHEDLIKRLVRQINTAYQFSCADSKSPDMAEGRQDILVAKVPSDHERTTEMDREPFNLSSPGLPSPSLNATNAVRTRILYFCPDIVLPSAGIRRLYRHVSILNNAGYNAAILHQRQGFSVPDLENVPCMGLNNIQLQENDIVVLPEGHPQVMHQLRDAPCRRFAIALNWDYIFKTLPDGMDWHAFNIERVLVVSPIIGNLVSWSMRLPYHVVDTGIDPSLYYYEPQAKQPNVVYIQRKAGCIDSLRRILGCRSEVFTRQIHWKPLADLAEHEYAAQIRQAWLFLNLSMAEGFPTSCLEAMQSGTLVAGFNGVGGQDLLQHNRNCVLAPNGDYLSLAFGLTPLLTDLLAGRENAWQEMIAQGLKSAAPFTPQAEARSLLDYWRSVL